MPLMPLKTILTQPAIILAGLALYWNKKMLKKRAQSIIEYVMLFMIVAAAIAVTHKYVYRSMNARLKQVQEELSYKTVK